MTDKLRERQAYNEDITEMTEIIRQYFGGGE